MSLAAVASLYNLGKSSTFAVRNVDKTANGDYVRGLVAVAQANNGVKAIAEWNNVVGNEAKKYIDALDAAAKPWDVKAEKVTRTCSATAAEAGVASVTGKKTAKGLAAYCLKTASNWINPLIVVSGGVKVATAKDKKTEAINQGCALGCMFAAEKIAFRILDPKGRALIQNKSFVKNSPIRTFLGTMAKIDRYAAGTKSTKFGKIAIPLAKAAAFVCASVGGYATGAKIADKINEARGVHPLIKNHKPVTSVSPAPVIAQKENLMEKDLEKQSLELIS